MHISPLTEISTDRAFHFLVTNFSEDYDDLGLTTVYAVPITSERCFCAATIFSRSLVLAAGTILYVSLSYFSTPERKIKSPGELIGHAMISFNSFESAVTSLLVPLPELDTEELNDSSLCNVSPAKLMPGLT